MAEIAYLPEVEDYLTHLIDILFEKEYFGFKKSAENYVFELIDYIESEAFFILHKPCPEKLKHLGDFYFTYKANNQTMWYVFFQKMKDKILITYVMNNHTPQAAELNLD